MLSSNPWVVFSIIVVKMKNFYLIVMFVFVVYHSNGQQKEYNFINFSSKNGLASNTINAILKDKYGFMWFGTEDGLNKFDGLNFTVYRHRETDSSSIGRGAVMAIVEDKSGNLWVGTTITLSVYDRSLNNFINYDFSHLGWIRSLCTDHLGNIWVGTYTGLYYFNTKTKKINAYRVDSANDKKLNSDMILCVFEDSKRNIWVGTKVGLHLFNPKDGNFRRFLHKNDNHNSISDNAIRTIAEDKNGNLWIGTAEGGLNVFNPINQTFSYFKSTKSDESTLSSNSIFKILFDNTGKLWVGTEDGLNIFDPKNAKFQRIKSAASSKYNTIGGFVGRSVRDIYLDNCGVYWISTLQGGVNKYDINLAFFNHKQFNPSDANGLSAGSITSFAESPSGDIYVGTDGGGLNVFSKNTGLIKRFSFNKTKENTEVILALELSGNELWIGTYFGGLYVVNTSTNAIRHFGINKSQTDVSNIPINCLKADSEGNIWIGTNGNGVYKYHSKTGDLLRFDKILPQQNTRNLTLTGYITTIEEDKQGKLWFGANGSGIAVYDPNSQALTFLNQGNSKLPLDRVLSIHCSKLGQIWVGVSGGGLCLYDTKSKQFKQYSEKQLLSNDVIYKILEDESGKLWVSTNKGISTFDLKKSLFKNYTHHNGIQQSTFNMGAGLRTRTGEMYFGGLDGFNYFNPAFLNRNKNTPSLVITDLKIGNKSINPIENSEIADHISVAKEIILSYKQNFSLDYVALNYTAPHENQYSYMLEGFDKEWNHAGTTTTAVYTNLDPGKYTFRLKAKSEDGSWHTPEKTIDVIVNPPFWRTYLAYVIYFLLVITTLWAIRRRGIQKLRNEFALEQERLEIRHMIERERTEAERKMELEQLKIKFLTNLSHELKTPLTLVLNPIESLLFQEQSIDKIETLNLINRNAKRLLNLVNQLLDFRKIEDNELKLNSTESDLIAVATEIFDSFKYISDRKNIKLHFQCTLNSYYTNFDKDKLERILINLLSNAIKFTDEGGSVYFLIEANGDDGIKLIIKDTGIGIPTNKAERIFERFFQINNNNNILNQGSGIGLSITQEFVKLHGGTIKVDSHEGVGSVFVVFLPLLLIVPQVANNDLLEKQEPGFSVIPPPNIEEDSKIDKPVILIVDDSDDLRTYLKENLKEKYRIFEAADGKQGWQKALSTHPDIIVSDINMPNMDGIALVRKIKNDTRTKHIPVILLTVLADEAAQLKGLQTGASDYLTKPFSFQLLTIKINNLLALNNTLKDTYTKHINLDTPDIELVSEDEKFLLKVSRYVEDHIEDPDLSVERLSKTMFMSRGTLYNKLLSLTGETPVEFVRTIKLKKAIVLLEKSDMKISQIGYAVGFSNPNYFARAFKAKYNVSPSEYIQIKKDSPKSPSI
jgi:signal transduction histidine kinase/ligand-binding sensor domain-containing protein/CheY-like chemotaxis protein/AraC-like DNA-binding protein